MELKPWEIWDAEERELKILREVVEILEREDDGDFGSAKLEEGIERVYEKISELKHEIWEKRKKYEEDERVVVLEGVMYTLMGEIEKLEPHYEDAKNEKLKMKLKGGIQAFGLAVNLVRYQLEKIAMDKELTKKVDY